MNTGDDTLVSRDCAAADLQMMVRMRAALSSPTARRVALVALYAVLAVWATWPLAQHSTTALPLGSMQVATVPLFNLWTIWWNADWWRYATDGYWNAPIFHPAADTFVFSEPQPTSILVAPVIWLTGSRVLAYNVYLWLSLVLNGLFTYRFLRALRINRVIATGSGAALLLLPIVHWQLEVVQLVPLWGVLWTWTACLRTAREPTLRRGAELGVAFALAFLICAHHGLFLAVLLAGAAGALGRTCRRPRAWPAWLLALVVAAALVGPVVARMRRAVDGNEFTRSRQTVTRLSAQPGDYTAATGVPLIDFGDAAARPLWRLGPGWIKASLAALAVAFGLWRRRWRRPTLFLLVTAILAFLLSLGPHLRIRDWHPWWTLTEVCPGFSQVRNVFRFAFFVQAVAVLLAALGLHGLCVLSRRMLPRGRWRIVATIALTTIGLAAVLEIRPKTQRLATVPNAASHAGWIEFIRDQTPSGRSIACLPFAQGNKVGDFESTTHWMYYGTFHGVPLVNGYSGFFPGDSFELRDAVNEALDGAFPTREILDRFADADVEFLVVRRSVITADDLEGVWFDSVSIQRVFDDAVGIDVYRLKQLETTHQAGF